ncbi:hypothetical protein L1987_20793 [Smallanthus sonchifolius]|uniref:Uncharacterized protein n=1 Tax=Smallanthus sonchifolius TaxID=185202 RepID=A0ACB9IVL5_9ASTR|nr:hypothetical protein L1987_20793 [Smallanthus sonchifolius]
MIVEPATPSVATKNTADHKKPKKIKKSPKPSAATKSAVDQLKPSTSNNFAADQSKPRNIKNQTKLSAAKATCDADNVKRTAKVIQRWQAKSPSSQSITIGSIKCQPADDFNLNKTPPEKILLTAQRKDNLYVLDMNKVTPYGCVSCFLSKALVDESAPWHRRLSHINVKTINKLVKGNLVRGLPVKEFQLEDHCIACLKGRQHKSSHKPKTLNSNDTPLQLLHMDMFGPTNVMSKGKKSYCLVITEDYTRFSWEYFLRTKDETTEILKSFILRDENQKNQKVKTISAPRTPQQNGVAERRNITLIESARSMLADSKLPLTFWAELFDIDSFCQTESKKIDEALQHSSWIEAMQE